MTSLKPELISIVVPVYKGEAFVNELYSRVKDSVLSVFANFELILVNDASPDQSWQLIESLCANDKRVKGINLSRNFGQHYAITAGLSFVTGEWCVVMDCDLQDRPEEIHLMFAKAQEGFDSVLAQRLDRQHSWLKCFQSRMFYMMFSYLTDTKMDPTVANFGIYHRRVIDAILSMGDRLRYFPTMVQWVGFRKAYCPVQHDERKSGATSYSLIKLLRLASDTILSFSEKPLRICVSLGFFVTTVSFVFAIAYFIGAMLKMFSVSGFASIMISLWFVSGVIMMMLGLIGVYLGKLFNQVKARPVYIASQKLNLE
jgi:glycosyltransferase involved in cell wall biosynthesis